MAVEATLFLPLTRSSTFLRDLFSFWKNQLDICGEYRSTKLIIYIVILCSLLIATTACMRMHTNTGGTKFTGPGHSTLGQAVQGDILHTQSALPTYTYSRRGMGNRSRACAHIPVLASICVTPQQSPGNPREVLRNPLQQ